MRNDLLRQVRPNCHGHQDGHRGLAEHGTEGQRPDLHESALGGIPKRQHTDWTEGHTEDDPGTEARRQCAHVRLFEARVAASMAA